MNDILIVLATALLFGIAHGYVTACDQLKAKKS